MSRIDLARRKVTYPSGRIRETYILFAPEVDVHWLGARVHLGGRRNLLSLRRKIDKYLNGEKEKISKP